MTASPVPSSVSSSAPMDPSQALVTIPCGKGCRQISLTALGRTTSWVESQPSRSITARTGMHSCSNGPRMPSTKGSGGRCGRVPDSHLRSRQVANWARWQQISECGLLHQLPDRSAPRLTECRLTFEMPVVSEVDTAGASISTPLMECIHSLVGNISPRAEF